MSWVFDDDGRVVLLRMNSSAVNIQNPAFFADLHEALDRVEALPGPRAVVLTGEGTAFSAGLDFKHVFPLFARADPVELQDWFHGFRQTLMRLFTFDRPTIAAINGHAMAGGLLLALACDVRIAARVPLRCGLNEVPVGIPMPSVYIELTRERIGSANTAKISMEGRLYSAEEGLALGFWDELVAPEALLARARQRASEQPLQAISAWAHTKRMCLAPVLERIQHVSKTLDLETLRVLASPELAAVRTATFAALMQKSR